MALRVEDADEMIEACERAGVRLFVVKQSRYNPPVEQLRAALAEGRFGRLVMGTARVRRCRRQDYYDSDPWRGTLELDGGVLANQASHHIDLLLWMLGEVRSVYAKTTTRLVDIETEDTAAVILQFANGALGMIEATTAARPVDLESSISILGERGAVVIGGTAMDELVTWKFDETRSEDVGGAGLAAARDPGYPLRAFLADVIRTVRGHGSGGVDGPEGRKSLEVIRAFYASAAAGHEVTLPYHPPP
jgi:predicted dehydrogenase